EALNNANEKVTALPDGDDKSDLKGRLDELENITVPEEGTYNQDVADAEAAVAEAEAADQAAKDALEAANEDDYITPEEVEALQKAHDDAKAAKEAAEEAVAKVPAGSDKDGFEERLEALDNIEVPEATDAEGYAELVADAEAAVAEAEAADQAAQDALEAANEDDYITPEEVEALQKARSEE